MESSSQLVWLITGCSSGFGAEFVAQIRRRGDLVIATSRKLDKIQYLEQPGVSVLQLDVNDSQDSLNETVAKAISIHGRIDALVNNAGYIATGSWEDLGYADFLAQFETNVFGVIRVTRAVLPHFRARRTGTMVFMGSRSAWYGDPFCGAYSGSKFALEGIVESLRWETAPFGIRTLLIHPGRFRTAFLSSSGGGFSTVKAEGSEYQAAYAAFLGYIAKEDGNQPGDVQKGVGVILDFVRREGVAEGREVPFRMPLGADCFETIKQECEETLAVLKEWESVIEGTDI
ncbi:hypothetical protein GE09DRAFT_1107991 [Coniochaeta sp. 2T2.1]|nr:hypothetical protein GE09DRAFT_1107991 [Coniochaeta sp. 2T2.1]